LELDGGLVDDKSIPENWRFGLAVLISKAKSEYLLMHVSPERFRYFRENATVAANGMKPRDSVIPPFKVEERDSSRIVILGQVC
jgi:hypothetical protein